MRLLRDVSLVCCVWVAATIFQVNGYNNYHASPYTGNCSLQLSKGKNGVYHAYTGNNQGLYASGNSGASYDHGSASSQHSTLASSSNGNNNNDYNPGYYGSYGSYGSSSGRYPYLNSASQYGSNNNNYQGSSSSALNSAGASGSNYGTGGSYGNGGRYNTAGNYGTGSLAGSGVQQASSNYGNNYDSSSGQSTGSSSNSGLSSSLGSYGSGSGWSQTQENGYDDSDGITSSFRFSRDVLAAHNSYRARHSTPPVTLDDTMSRKAQEWANAIASGRSSYGHSPEAVEGIYGESIQALNFETHSGASLMEGWYDEVDNYNYKHPLIVRSPRNKRNSHFTAMLWYATRKIGVGKATSPDGKSYVVISYYPPGNNVDVLEDNVFPPKN